MMCRLSRQHIEFINGYASSGRRFSGQYFDLQRFDSSFLFCDVEDVKFVINFDYPTSSEDYVHRIGRTGRSQQTGTAYAFFTSQNVRHADELISVLTESNQKVNPELLQMADMYKNGSMLPTAFGKKGKGGGNYSMGGKMGKTSTFNRRDSSQNSRGGRDKGRGGGSGYRNSGGNWNNNDEHSGNSNNNSRWNQSSQQGTTNNRFSNTGPGNRGNLNNQSQGAGRYNSAGSSARTNDDRNNQSYPYGGGYNNNKYNTNSQSQMGNTGNAYRQQVGGGFPQSFNFSQPPPPPPPNPPQTNNYQQQQQMPCY